MMKRRALLIAAVLVPSLGAAAELPPPAVSVQVLTDGLIRIMKAGRAVPFAERMRMLTPAVEQVFDLPLILRRSVGTKWPGFTDTAKAQLLHAFETFTISTWVANFDSFEGETFEISPELRLVPPDTIVQTRLVPKSGDATRLDFVMREVGAAVQGGPGVWRAVDILLNGSISRVAVQRSDFRAIIDSGDPGPLIALLQSKTAALAAASGKS